MKSINIFITEKLKISKRGSNYTLFPETKDELVEMIKKEIEQKGDECDLNHIDVSKITDLSYLFSGRKTHNKIDQYDLNNFNGDISEWDVSNIEDMSGMFSASNFNDDISGWDVSNVIDMNSMFKFSKFNQDISNWNVSNVEEMWDMFFYAISFNQDISNWDVSKVTNMGEMFRGSKFTKDISNWKINNNCLTLKMFDKCPIEYKYKPFKNGIRIK